MGLVSMMLQILLFLRQCQRYLGEIRISIDPRLDDFSEFIAIVLIKKVTAILENL